jgi:predicted Ser/Thr protein kinase
MDLSEYTSQNLGTHPGNAPGAPDATMLLSDSQQGSQSDSSSVAGKSSYDQTMDLSESASESKSGSEVPSIANSSKTGQSVPQTGKSNFKSVGDSRQYLQAERAKASDAFLDRVTERKISYTIDWNDVSADYQINKKMDPKTGKLDLNVLGKGGMGLVYLATQNSVNRSVALKVIRKDKQTEAFSKQFFYEAEITAQLEHPNITPIYELGRTPDGTFFYSMKYIQGIPWEKKIRENTIDENLEIFDKLCDAIGFAHSKNIIHMDIKPDNVQLGEYGEVYAVDWGVASNLKRPESIRCAGTWQWISPEVSRGERDKIGKCSDIYLLGGVLFLIVTGHHPRLPKDPAAKMGQSGLAKAAQNNLIQPTDCKDPMVAVALKALATNPSDRYDRVEDLQDAIHAIQKERANIKSSQELTERAKVLAKEAQAQGDYDRFTRSMYGFKDAVELWDNNPEAPEELKQVRLAYGQCAFEKGDYDLALQTLDRTEHHEDQLYLRAEQAQTAVKQRAKRLWWLSRLFVASLLAGSGIVGYLWLDAENARQRAVKSADDARIAEVAARKAEGEARKAEGEARTAEGEARTAEGIAKKAQEDEEIARKNAQENERIAIDARKEEEKAKDLAIQARQKAEEQLAKTQLTEIASQLGLARSRINEANPSGADDLLGGINQDLESWTEGAKKKAEDPDSKYSKANRLISNLPNIDNWANSRVALLANRDLNGVDLRKLADLPADVSADKVAFAIDPKDDSLVAATPEGKIYRVGANEQEPVLIWDQAKSEVSWDGLAAVRRVVPSRKQNQIFLVLDRPENPVLLIDLDNRTTKPYGINIKQAGQQLALSPVSRHIASAQPGYIWFTKNQTDSIGNGVPTNQKAIQIRWLTDDLILALIENSGSYHLQLIAPFINQTDTGLPTFVQVTVPLADDIIQFAILDEELPEQISGFDPSKLKDFIEKPNGERLSKTADELFAEMIASLHFVVGQGDGNLIQARIQPDPKNGEISSNLWRLVDQYPLPRKHLHIIKEILVESAPTSGANNRRIITRANEEQAVQVWSLSSQNLKRGSEYVPTITHLHALTGGPINQDKGNNGILFTGFGRSGEVVLVNSQLKAFRLDVQEQLNRKRITMEVPFGPAAFLETTANWLFSAEDQGEVLAVDSYGAAALYATKSNESSKVGGRLGLNSTASTMRLQLFPGMKELIPDKDIIQIQSPHGFQYWGHSPYAEIQNFTFSPEGDFALSLANIPGAYGVYYLPRDTKERADAIEFKEICLWDLKNKQMIDRLVLQSKYSLDRLSTLDNQRFVFGNTETFATIERQATSQITSQMAKCAVHFCVRNPQYPLHAFFQAEGIAEGTCWIGSVPFDQPGSNETAKWLSKEDNRMALFDSAPVAGCWSRDGLRLYVLDRSCKIRKYDLDPATGMLSATIGQDSPDIIEPDQQIKKILGRMVSHPEKVLMGIANSSKADGTWSDDLFIELVDIAKLLTGLSANEPTVHAIFSSNTKADWKLDSSLSEEQLRFRDQAEKFFKLAGSNRISRNKNSNVSYHQPLHVTGDAKARLTLLHYPSCILFLSKQIDNSTSWFRLEKTLNNLNSFELSPDGSILSTVDDSGLHLHKVIKDPNTDGFSLVAMDHVLANQSSVTHFAWDKNRPSDHPNDPLEFAYIMKDGTTSYHRAGTDTQLTTSEGVRKIEPSEILGLWFFDEVLVDRLKANPSDPKQFSSQRIRYIAIQYENQDQKDGKSSRKVRFIHFGNPIQSQQVPPFDWDVDPSVTEVLPNQQGGIIVTGDQGGNVVVYQVSPLWRIDNRIFDATSEADSPIECLSFAEQGNTLIISNGNNHIFGLPSKPNAKPVIENTKPDKS